MKQKIFLIIIILIGIVSNMFPQQKFRDGMFLHHSVGGCIWLSPDSLGTTSIPDEMTAYNILHNYTGNDVVTMIEDWFPLGAAGNEWELWHRIFDGYTGDGDISSYYGSYDIIVIKSCYPSSVIDNVGSPSDTLTPTIKSIYNYKWHWRNIVRVMEQHPDNFFAIWTNAPYRGGNGELSHQFCKWAKDTLATGNDPIFGDFPDNVYVFDFFHKLASAGSNWWLPDYYSYWNGSGFESHPNGRATDLVAPLFVQEIFDAAIAYEGITPVELTLFNGDYEDGVVNLQWITATETNNYGFEVERRNDNSAYESIGFVNGNGTSTNKITYNFVDDNLFSNRYYYRLKQIDLDGTFEYSDEVMIEIDGLGDFQLSQNYPNPFNPSTEINFTLVKPGNVTLIVYDYLGSIVATLADRFMRSGKHSVKFDAKDLTSGVYFYRIETDNFTSTRKMLLIK